MKFMFLQFGADKKTLWNRLDFVGLQSRHSKIDQHDDAELIPRITFLQKTNLLLFWYVKIKKNTLIPDRSRSIPD